MPNDSSTPIPLVYETPKGERQFPGALARLAAVCGVAAPLVGFLILVFYWITDADFFLALGMVWILVGGGCAGLATLISFVGWLLNAFAPGRPTRKNLVIALTGSVISVPTCVVCVLVGREMALKEVTIIVQNNSTQNIATIDLRSRLAAGRSFETLTSIPARSTKRFETDHHYLLVDGAWVVAEGKTLLLEIDAEADRNRPVVTIVLDDQSLARAVTQTKTAHE
ncbi:MAG TPA: hypothetical protein VGB55_09785 [Tepidisphaeraceae bacterium]|jgi:hypothetical protein